MPQRHDQNEFKDLQGRELKVGQIVLNFWYSYNSSAKSDDNDRTGPLCYRRAQITKINKKSVRIFCTKEKKYRTVFNIRNKLLVIEKFNGCQVQEDNAELERFELMDFDE